MSPTWRITKPKTDDAYFERMTKTLFSAGLNWKVVDNKWPSFRKVFSGFSPSKVSRFTDKNVRTLMKNPEIVRNEKKLKATVYNAGEFLKIHKDFGPFKGYLDSFGKNEERLLSDLQNKFQHIGPSSARTFLWSVGYQLTPNAEEKKWMAAHRKGKET
jgi:DNA-3-methyladenine glycosylase I